MRKHNVIIRTSGESNFKGGKKVSNKKYREKDGNTEKQKEYMKTYYPEYREKNKDILNNKSKIHYRKNYEKNRKVDKEYYKNNQEKIKAYREKYKNKRNELHSERIDTDSLYKLTCNIRGLIKQGFKKNKYMKISKTQEILGCSFDEFKLYLESKFESWMNWENMGNPKDGVYEMNKTWDLDHIIPISSAKTEDDVIKLNHYTNFQPLCSYVNRFIKRNL